MHNQCEIDKRYPEPKKIHVDVFCFELHKRRTLPDSTHEEFYLRFTRSEFDKEWQVRNPGRSD